MSWRDDLAAFGVKVPERLSLDEWATSLAENPCQNTFAVVGLSAVLFCLAERGRNPKVNDIWDSLVYCSTCISVGYGDIFARTPIGKILGSTLMTIGPALAAKTLDGPALGRRDAAQQEALSILKQILSTLQSNRQEQGNAPAPAPPAEE